MKILLVFVLLSTQALAKLDIQHWTTPEGAQVLFAQTKGLPMLDIALNFDAASSRDGEKFGLASLTNALLGTATKTHSEEEIIHAFETVGAQFSATSLKDMAIVQLRTLTRPEYLQKSLSLFAEVVAEPEFQQAHLSHLKNQTRRSIQAKAQSVGAVASEAFNRAIFADHPYAYPSSGNEETLSALRLSDIRQHYKTHYVARNLTIALVGDVSKMLAKRIARQISHGLNRGQKPTPNATVVRLATPANLHLNFDSKQTHLLIGQTGINRSHPDYYALYLGNHILGGGGLTSILSDEIREQRGLAYSASTMLSKMQSNGYFRLSLQTKSSQLSQAKAVALATLKRFLAQPISAAQLSDGKANIIGGFALETASNSGILTYLSIIGFYDLPLDYLATFTSRIDKVSAADIQNAFNRLIDLDKLVVVSVGKFAPK